MSTIRNSSKFKLGSGKMFDNIADKYDFINKIMSFGMDRYWRSQMTNFLNLKENSLVLDLATGTADVAIDIALKIKKLNKAKGNNFSLSKKQIIGLDTSNNMIKFGKNKLDRYGLNQNEIVLKYGDAQNIKYSDNSFDIVTMAFGIRNVFNRKLVLNEIHRVVKLNTGRVGILELNTPTFFLARWFVKNIIPLIGYIFSNGVGNEYQHLESSIFNFPSKNKFIKELKDENFDVIIIKNYMFGCVSLYILKAI